MRLFSRNLYAREQLAESKRTLMKGVKNSLLSLDIHISEFDVPTNSTFCGHTLKNLSLRGATGVNIVSITRSGININIPNGDNRIFPNDRLVVAGTDEQMDAFKKQLEGSISEDTENIYSIHKIELDNLIVESGSKLIGKNIMQSNIRSEAQCIVMGVIRPDEASVMVPHPDLTFSEGDVIILAGERENIKNLQTTYGIASQ
jgi:CPA2 family monovalent cation:H+ antiporter-2